MKQANLDNLQSLFDNARADLQNLKLKLDAAQHLIAEDKLIPDSLSAEIQDSLSICRISKDTLIAIVNEFALSEEISLSDIENELRKRQATSEIRRLLVDFFRLASEADSILSKLNEVKQSLKKKCQLPHDELQAALVPYRIVVDYVSGKAAEISDEQSLLIEDTMGRSISRAIDKGLLFLGDVHEGEKWLESIEDFAPQKVTHEAPASESLHENISELITDRGDKSSQDTDPTDEPANAPESDSKRSEQLETAPEKWPGFSGYITERTVEFRDVPANNLKFSDFKNLVKKKTAYLSVLDRMHEIKMIRLDSTLDQYHDADIESKTIVDSLIEQGYLAIATFTKPEGHNAEFVHITSKGCEALLKYYREKMPLPVFRNWCLAIKKPVEQSDLYFNRCKLLRDWLTQNPDMTERGKIIKTAWTITCANQDSEYVFTQLLTEDKNDCFFVVPALFTPGKEQQWMDIIIEALNEYKDRCRVNILVQDAGDIHFLHDAICLDHPEYESRIQFICTMNLHSPETLQSAEKEELHDSTLKASETFEPDLEPAETINVDPAYMPGTVASKPVISVSIPSVAPKKRNIEVMRDKIAAFEKKAYEAFAKGRQDVGSVILKSLCLETKDEKGLEDEYLRLLQKEEQYAFASGDPMLARDYRASNLQTVFNMPYGKDEAYDALAIAAALRMFFSADAGIEAYGAANLQFANNILLKNNAALNDLLYELASYVKDNFAGIDNQLLSIVFKHGNVNKKMDEARKVAQEWCVGNWLLSSRHANARIIENRKRLFGPDTVLRMALETVASNDTAQIANVRRALTLVHNRVTLQNIEQLMDETWDTTAHTKDKMPLVGAERTSLTKLLRSIYLAFEEWLDAAQFSDNASFAGSDTAKKTLSIAYAKLSEAQQIFERSPKNHESVEVYSAQIVLEKTILEMLQRFETPDITSRARDSYYIHLLEHPLIAVLEGFIPYIESPSEETSQFNFCERACEYLSLPEVDWSSAISRFFKKEPTRIGGDYGCASVLHDYLELYETLDIWPAEYGNIDRFAEEAKNPRNKAVDAVQTWQQNFQGRLDMADGDEWFREPDEHKRLEGIIHEQKRAYYFTNNFGFYGRAMLRVLNNMSKDAEQLQSEYQKQLQSVQSSSTIFSNAPIYALAAKMIEKNRFGAFRSYLQMAEHGETDVIESRLSNQQSYFAKFYMQCSDLCSKTRLTRDQQTLLAIYRKSGLYRENATGRTALMLMQNWIESESANPQNQAGKVRNIVEALGIKVDQAYPDGTGIHLSLNNPGRVISYPHPIADFGSRMYANGLQVQALYGNLLPADVLFTKIREILQRNKQQSFLILVNCAIPLDERRKFAKLIAENMIQSPFIILDRVLALFLVGIPQAERWKAVLQCSLPFHIINPYSENSAVEIPPEMFIGRTSELDSIRSSGGANLIYGGRQLGKTALLKRARILEHQPMDHSWAIYEDIKNKKGHDAATRIAKTLVQEKFFAAMPEIRSWADLISCIEDRLMGNQDKLLLLLDEADAFLVEAGSNDYEEIDDLKRLQDRANPRFKCVMAGLHNVLRTNNIKALTNNSSLAHLQGLTIEPLDFKDARALLEIPLSYLGFTIPEEDEDIITQILYNTNYFPGLVHFYASRLVEYAKKNSNAMKEPPYELKTETLLSLLAEQDFHDLRNDRIRMTLYIDAKEHSYYDILATTMCYGYNNSDEYKLFGMTAEDIRAECVSLAPTCSISRLNEPQLKALLDELVTLNIFREENGHYQFRRPSFTEIFSSPEEVESHFLEILTREEQ